MGREAEVGVLLLEGGRVGMFGCVGTTQLQVLGGLHKGVSLGC